jgi:uncharacterized protein DUF6348
LHFHLNYSCFTATFVNDRKNAIPLNMKHIIARILSLLNFPGRKNASNKTKDETPYSKVAQGDSNEKIALQFIFQKIKKSSNASIKDDKIFIGNSSIGLKIQVEAEEQKAGKWIYAANITTTYTNTNVTQIHVGSIGIGSNRDEAVDVCIQEWFGLFGIAFTNMLNGENGIRVSSMKVFPGLMGIRGQLPENAWPEGEEEKTKNIIQKTEPVFKDKTGIIPIDIKLMIGKNGIIDGECRVNNQVSTEVLNNLKQLSWPSSEQGFMFKQFYLVESL